MCRSYRHVKKDRDMQLRCMRRCASATRFLLALAALLHERQSVISSCQWRQHVRLGSGTMGPIWAWKITWKITCHCGRFLQRSWVDCATLDPGYGGPQDMGSQFLVSPG